MHDRGFSLAEILVAIFVVTIAALGLISVLIYGTRANGQAQKMALATHLCREIVAAIRNNELAWPPGALDANLVDSPSDRRDLDAPPLDGMGLPVYQDMKRNVLIEQDLSPTGSDHRDKLARITVRVFWTHEDQERSVEMTAFQPRKE